MSDHEEPGLLGNLPRTRPGQRSARRAGTKTAAAATRPSAGKPAQRPPRPRRPAESGAAPDRPDAQAPPVGSAGERGLIGATLGVVGRATEIGARGSWGLARAVLRRVPRP